MPRAKKPKRGRPMLKPEQRLVNVSVTVTREQKAYLNEQGPHYGSVANLLRSMIQKSIDERNGNNP